MRESTPRWGAWILRLGMLLGVASSSADSLTLRLGTWSDSLMPGNPDASTVQSEIDVVRCAFDQLDNVEASIHILPWPRLRRMAWNGKLDAWFPDIRDSASQVFGQMSIPLSVDEVYLYYRSEIAPITLNDLWDSPILVVQDSLEDRWLESTGHNDFFKVRGYDSLIRAFLVGRANYMVLNRSHLLALSDERVEALSDRHRQFLGYLQQGVYFDKTRLAANPDLLSRFNRGLRGCRSDASVLPESNIHVLDAWVPIIQTWTRNTILLQHLQRLNDDRSSWPAEEVEAIEAAWRQTDHPLQEPDLIQHLDPELARQLSQWQEQQNGVVSEIFVTDANGWLAATVEATSDFIQSDERIFQSVADGDRRWHVSTIRYDESSQLFQSQISIPVLEDGTLLGVLVVGIDVETATRYLFNR